jgi:uncharacterized protein (TIGR00290 family)
MANQKAVFHWSGGKDSALCLYKISSSREFHVSRLLTSVNEQHQRISMHGVRVQLLEEQAVSIGIPLVKMLMPEIPAMETYESILKGTLQDLKRSSISVLVFGDIFLQDLRKYREDQLSKVGFKAVFPLWYRHTTRLIREFIDLGFKAVIVCVNEKYLDQSFVGRRIDEDFLADLPPNVDPCGEHGEFHSFVYDGPIFDKRIEFNKGEIVYRKYRSFDLQRDHYTRRGRSDDDPFKYGLWYCDLISTDAHSTNNSL